MKNPLLNYDVIKHKFNFKDLTPENISNAIDVLIPKVEENQEKIAMQAGLTFKELFLDNKDSDLLSMIVQLLGHLNHAAQTPEIRRIQQEYLPKVQKLYQKQTLDERFYYKLGAYTYTKDYESLPEIQKNVIHKVLSSFENRGCLLEDDKKDKLLQIDLKLIELEEKFSNNLLDTKANLKLDFKIEELEGLPDRCYQSLIKTSNNIYTIEYNSGLFGDIMDYCTNKNSRKRVYEALKIIGTDKDYDNSLLLDEIVSLKHQRSKILGFNTYSELAMLKNMLYEPSQALNFAHDLAQSSFEQAKKEIDMLNEYSKTYLGFIPDFEDKSFVKNKLKQEMFSFNSEDVRRYFKLDNVIDGLFGLLKDLYDLEFKKNNNSTWHEDVQSYDVYELGNLIGHLYLDMYQRDFKTGGAWMQSIVSKNELNDNIKLPVAYICCNNSKSLENDTTIEFQEIITLFHEMGHALHNLLSKVPEEYFSGLNNVQHDAIELPSQFMENFVWDYNVLKNLSFNKDTNEFLPRELYDKMLSSKQFFSANTMLYYAKLSYMDMLLHSDLDAKAKEVENMVFDKWAVSARDNEYFFMPKFSHIFSGSYSAGYYAYQWAEVLATDSFFALKEMGESYQEQKPMANKFKEHILSTGGQKDMADNFYNFRGRDAKIDYLLESYGITSKKTKMKLL